MNKTLLDLKLYATYYKENIIDEYRTIRENLAIDADAIDILDNEQEMLYIEPLSTYLKRNKEINNTMHYKSKIDKAISKINEVFKDEEWYYNYSYNDLEFVLKEVRDILLQECHIQRINPYWEKMLKSQLNTEWRKDDKE